jgi:hypothetical protein
MSHEHRQFPRKTVKVDIHASHMRGVGQLIFESLDLSGGGAFLKCDLLLEVGDGLQIEFELPSGTVFESKAIIAWVRRFPKAGEAAGMGISFRELDEARLHMLSAFLNEQNAAP